ncbi:MAG: molecular chaperone HtpG, partial [Candidatus Sumerlaeaceae bacterium]|nr:molecular chaperone HtpG [Candidatus Sumerlaeaceae bacterium]
DVYKRQSHDWAEPLKRISYKAEGTAEFRALLFLPSRAPFGLFLPEREHTGIHLYVKRVFIMHDCKELIPEYLRFVRGVVDSEDLSLNISRELLQKNRQIGIIRKGLTKKVLDTLKGMMTDDQDKYFTFWKEFGRLIKEGVFSDSDHRKALLDLCLFDSTAPRREGDDAAPWEKAGMTTLKAYVDRMPQGQDTIYYMTGATRAAVEGSPHLEAFRDKGFEVLILTDPVDEVWPQVVADYSGKKLMSVGKGETTPGTEEERKKAAEELKEKAAEFKPLTDALARVLEDRVKEVRLSARLTSSPACLVGEEFDISPRMEALLKAAGQEVTPSKRILELNPTHPVVERLREACAADPADPRIDEYAELLYGQALLAEGGTLPDAAAFTRRVADLMTRALAG